MRNDDSNLKWTQIDANVFQETDVVLIIPFDYWFRSISFSWHCFGVFGASFFGFDCILSGVFLPSRFQLWSFFFIPRWTLYIFLNLFRVLTAPLPILKWHENFDWFQKSSGKLCFLKDAFRRETSESAVRLRTTFDLIFRPKIFDVLIVTGRTRMTFDEWSNRMNAWLKGRFTCTYRVWSLFVWTLKSFEFIFSWIILFFLSFFYFSTLQNQLCVYYFLEFRLKLRLSVQIRELFTDWHPFKSVFQITK